MNDYSARDKNGRVVFYVLLWKRRGISLELYDDYWRNVHGPVCARLPGQFQYWQLHVAHNEGGVWPQIAGIRYDCPEESQFDGIAELTFKSDGDRTTWFQAAGILMDDEHNLFRKAIGYNTSEGNSRTYVDRLAMGAPNGPVGVAKFHVMVKKARVSVEDFRNYLTKTFAPAIASSDLVIKFRMHLFEEVDASRPDAAGVAHSEPAEESYQAAFEIAFADHLGMEAFFQSKAYAVAIKDQPNFIQQICPFPERSAYTFVYDGRMTLSGERSSTVAELITNIGATNQLRDDIRALMLGTTLGVWDMRKRVNFYKDLAADYSKPDPIAPDLARKLLDDAAKFIAKKEKTLPAIGPDYTLQQIEAENKAWWPTHCEALRQGRGDLLTGEYRDDLVYHCQDGPYYGIEEQKPREQHWWALIAQPGVRMTWPVAMFSGEFVWFEWACLDMTTGETIAKGSVSWVRRGHRGACYYKGEQLTFYRDVFAPDELIKLITK